MAVIRLGVTSGMISGNELPGIVYNFFGTRVLSILPSSRRFWEDWQDIDPCSSNQVC